MVDALTAAGRSVVALDARGHGESDHPHDPALYGESLMSIDVIDLVAFLGIDEYDLVGYSMGGIVAALVGTRDPRVRRLCLGGIGGGVVEIGGVDQRVVPRDLIAEALESADASTIQNPAALGFRLFAESQGSDLLALAAQARSAHAERIPLEKITAPTLVVAGTEDPLAARPEVLAAAVKNGTVFTMPGDHLAVPSSPVYHRRVVDFLS
jgi:pimeloyl-ACP methyl ester carboxylesterase